MGRNDDLAMPSPNETSRAFGAVLRALATTSEKTIRGAAQEPAATELQRLAEDFALFATDGAAGAVDLGHVLGAVLRASSCGAIFDVHVTGAPGVFAACPPRELAVGLLFLFVACAEGVVVTPRGSLAMRVSERDGAIVLELDAPDGAGPQTRSELVALATAHLAPVGGTVTRRLEAPGLALHVTLPAAPPKPATPLPAATARRGRVLVVDDEASIVNSIKRILGRDYDVVGLTRAAEAVRLLEAGERFDLILCDLNMPEMNGMDFYSALQRVSEESVGRLVFVTGGGFTPTERAFLASIANERYSKPMEVSVLRALVKRVIG